MCFLCFKCNRILSLFWFHMVSRHLSFIPINCILIFSWLGAERKEEKEDHVSLEEWLQVSAIPQCSPQSLQAAMQLVNIQMLAFTPPNTLPWRVYLYTHAQYACSGDTPYSKLILGELLYTGEAKKSLVLSKGTCECETVEVKQVKEQEEHKLNKRELERIVGEGNRIKVTLKQQSRDDKALKGFLSILTAVLHTLSSDRD